MKTLLLHYMPSGAESNTVKVFDLFLNAIKDQPLENIEEVNLLEEPMPIFDEASMQAYYKRNYGCKALDAVELDLLAQNDYLIGQLKAADTFSVLKNLSLCTSWDSL